MVRVILGVLFIGGSIWSFVSPYNAFWALAAALGLLLILNGAFDIAYAATAQPLNPLWWLGLVVGILEIGLGFWASQQYVAVRANLLILWVGFYALFRGIRDLVIASRCTPLPERLPRRGYPQLRSAMGLLAL